tara:strand:- start:1633 stop:1938 length:306 start_codon:yes stop_codon:yes gene_type:complete
MANKVDIKDLPEAIGAPAAICSALIRGGLLGYTDGKIISQDAIEDYKKYLTQWSTNLSPRRYPVDQLPTPEGLAGGEQPASTQTEVIIAPGVDPLDAKKTT